MAFAAKTLRVDLVNILRAGGPRCEPSVLGDHFQSADRSAIAGCAAEYAQNLFARQLLAEYPPRREFRQHAFLPRGRRRLNPVGEALAEFTRKLAVNFTGIAAHPRRDFR